MCLVVWMFCVCRSFDCICIQMLSVAGILEKAFGVCGFNYIHVCSCRRMVITLLGTLSHLYTVLCKPHPSPTV